MMINAQLFEGEKIRLTPVDLERDPQAIAGWFHDSEFLSMLNLPLTLPRSPSQIKKAYEEIEKEQDEKSSVFNFMIRRKEEDNNTGGTLVGFARIFEIEWSNATGQIMLGIGDAHSRGKGYGSEALRLLLDYAFTEINFHRLGARIPEYNEIALHTFEKAGFTVEARSREALNRYSRHWDLILLGLLRPEWEKTR